MGRGFDGRAFTACLRQGRRPVVVLAIAFAAFIASIAGGGFSYKNLTTFRFTPTSVLDCYDAYKSIDANFPDFTDKGKEVVVIRPTDPSNSGALLGAPGKALSNDLNQNLSPANLP